MSDTRSDQTDSGRYWVQQVQAHWPLLAGLLIMMIPTIVTLGGQSWSMEIGAHGPIVLATGAWLMFHAAARIPAGTPGGNGLVTAAILIAVLPLYIAGRAFDILSFEAVALWATGVAICWATTGRQIRKLAFPLLYLGFLIPPPGWVIDQATAPLQQFVSLVATKLLALFGYPILNSGVTIFIAQYQLLVEQACSGMNSIVGLTAISVFYIYVLYGASSWRYALLLMVFILPIAVLTNIVRVTVLVLITYYLGDAAAQGFLHMTTGIILFAIALVLMVGLDGLLRRVLHSQRWMPA